MAHHLDEQGIREAIDHGGRARLDAGLAHYVEEIVQSGLPGLRGYSGRGLRAQLDGYLHRIIERDFEEQGLTVRRPEVLKRWLIAYAAATATSASFEAIRDAATSGEGDKPAKTTTQPWNDALARLWILDPVPAWLPTQNELNRLAQAPKVEGALVALAPDDGAIRALSGGFDFTRSKFNRVTQANRQPGSNFKPFIYSAALEDGFTPATLVNDAPVVFDDPALEDTWRPENYSGRVFGPTRLREAMVNSRNLVSVRLLMGMGLEYARDYITDFGFDREELPAGMSMALGSASLSPMEMARAYAVFASGGYALEPNFIHSIRGPEDRIIWEPEWTRVCRDCPPLRGVPDEDPAGQPAPPAETPDAPVASSPGAPPLRTLTPDNAQSPEAGNGSTEITIGPPVVLHGPPVPRRARQVLSPQTTYLIRSMMEDVIRSGTGRRALALERTDLAGKTGTTNDQRDTWFVGFNNHVVTAVWVGLDTHESLGRQEQGGRTALPVWVDYMDVALEGVPETRMVMPPRLARVRIDPATGLRARPGNPDAIEELFHADNVPPLEPAAGSEEEESEDPYEIF